MHVGTMLEHVETMFPHGSHMFSHVRSKERKYAKIGEHFRKNNLTQVKICEKGPEGV